MLRLVRPGEPARPFAAEDELRPLAAAAAAGEPVATRTLLTALGPHLLRVVRRVLGGGNPDVEDVTQEAAMEVVRGLAGFRGGCSVLHFGSRVALPARRREAARKRALPEPPQALDDDRVPSDAAGPEAEAGRRAMAALVRALCEELPPLQAEALALHVVLGFTVHEIATTSGVPLETVRSRLRLAKAALLARALAQPGLRELVEETA